MRPLDKSRFRQEIEMFLDLYNQSLGGTWGFVPLSKREIDHMSASLKHLIIPELAMVASVEGKPIGAVFAIPDYNPRIKEIDGRLFPFGFLKLINKRRPFRRFRVISANVIPEYQRWGVGLVLLRSLIPKILATEFRRRGILVGARVEPPFPAQPGKRGSRAGKNLSHLRLSAAARTGLTRRAGQLVMRGRGGQARQCSRATRKESAVAQAWHSSLNCPRMRRAKRSSSGPGDRWRRLALCPGRTLRAMPQLTQRGPQSRADRCAVG